MADLKTLIAKYKNFFGIPPEFGAHKSMTDEKKAETLECCIENNISTGDLLSISKEHAYVEGRLILLPPADLRPMVTYDDNGEPILAEGASPEQLAEFDVFKAEFDADKIANNNAGKSKTHCSVWDYLMNEDLEKEGACKYGAREKR